MPLCHATRAYVGSFTNQNFNQTNSGIRLIFPKINNSICSHFLTPLVVQLFQLKQESPEVTFLLSLLDNFCRMHFMCCIKCAFCYHFSFLCQI
jgi:hypothetical protein